MGLKDIESANRQIKIFEIVLKANNFLSRFRLGSKKLKSYENIIILLKQEVADLIDYPEKYNKYFSKEGFVSYSSMNFEVIKKAVDLFENDDKKNAKKLIMQYYSADNIKKQMFLIKKTPEFKDRMKYINFALDDYKNERYYAVVPILLMMIDGIVSDALGKGFHIDKNDLDAWDSIVIQNNGLEAIKNIFTKSRKKTTTEPIFLPYRHGILHGRDLGYDNYEVALKCWVILFAVGDFIVDKKSEKERKAEYEEMNRPMSWKEISEDIHNREETKKSLSEWEPRKLDQNYIDKINEKKDFSGNEPEDSVIKYLDSWVNKNYGNMAKLESTETDKDIKICAGKLRNKCREIILLDYEVLEIIDEAVAVTQVSVELLLNYYGSEMKKSIDVRCVCRTKDNKVQTRDYAGSTWFILSLAL